MVFHSSCGNKHLLPGMKRAEPIFGVERYTQYKDIPNRKQGTQFFSSKSLI
ncbi:Uncharacterized protein APZ42_026563 [Daphnia magna]|uniref:Uncharacterized protein n=1 Tax=Daphnia magna TaxID=35525 RepID=A0A164S525_9CRUS|nr:Uncharacterized protein APZ42_026563 [Daphnia magna]